MKKGLPIILSTLLLLFCTVTLKAQYVLKEADRQYEMFNYSKAADLFAQAYKKKPTLHAAEHLAACYSFIKDYPQAEKWYGIAVKLPGSKTENTLNYAKALQQNSKYTEAKQEYESYFQQDEKFPANLKSRLLASCDSALVWMANPTKVTLENQAELNSISSDWAATNYQNGIVFTSDRSNALQRSKGIKPFLKFDGARLPDRKQYGWTGNGYLSLYLKQSKDSVSLFPLELPEGYHVGPASFTSDGNTMFFALTEIPPVIKDKLTTINIGIYSSNKNAEGKWGRPVAFQHNKLAKYNLGDPFISADGNRLYFSADMPGGLGGLDIYYVDKTGTENWSAPINLKQVNSGGNERSPFIDKNGAFYFSSDGWIGMGGLDVYEWVKKDEDSGVIRNLGYPLNSAQDDFAFSLSNTSSQGYLSSNRAGGEGSDDIYTFDKRALLVFKLKGKVYDKNNNKPLNGALLTLAAQDGKQIKVETNPEGSFSFDLDADTDYSLLVEKTPYASVNRSLSTKGLTKSALIEKDLFLELVGLDKTIRIENIYYDFDKSNIRPDAAIELDKLVHILQENPAIKIELGSHTDSRGSDDYNQALSQKRAEAAVAYIISKGIDKTRIEAKGYGEQQLLNHCKNGVACSPDEHQLNRRTEFKIIEK